MEGRKDCFEDYILEACHIVKDFEKTSGKGMHRVLDDISFGVRRREFLSIIGPSGCGKSTLIRIAAGLETATRGEFRLDGKIVRGTGAERGMVFQKYSLFPWLSVKKNVMFGLESTGHDSDDAEYQKPFSRSAHCACTSLFFFPILLRTL